MARAFVFALATIQARPQQQEPEQHQGQSGASALSTLDAARQQQQEEQASYAARQEDSLEDRFQQLETTVEDLGHRLDASNQMLFKAINALRTQVTDMLGEDKVNNATIAAQERERARNVRLAAIIGRVTPYPVRASPSSLALLPRRLRAHRLRVALSASRAAPSASLPRAELEAAQVLLRQPRVQPGGVGQASRLRPHMRRADQGGPDDRLGRRTDKPRRPERGVRVRGGGDDNNKGPLLPVRPGGAARDDPRVGAHTSAALREEGDDRGAARREHARRAAVPLGAAEPAAHGVVGRRGRDQGDDSEPSHTRVIWWAVACMSMRMMHAAMTMTMCRTSAVPAADHCGLRRDQASS